MRCQACDRELTDFEATRKSDISGDFLDLCNSCIYWILPDINTTENYELYDPDQDDLDSIIEHEIPDSQFIADEDESSNGN